MKRIFGLPVIIILAVALLVSVPLKASATAYDYGDATGYTAATNTDPRWQRLGTNWDSETAQKTVDTSDDGVLWSVNGGAYGNSAITAGDAVTFQFTMYKEFWGQHDTDYLKVWLDTTGNGFDSTDVILATYLVFTPKNNPWNYNTPGATGDAQQTYLFESNPISFSTVGDFWLRARVTCNESLTDYGGPVKGTNDNIRNANRLAALNNFSPTKYYWQGETEDWMLTVTNTPLPAAVWLLGSGLMGLFGIRRKFRA